MNANASLNTLLLSALTALQRWIRHRVRRLAENRPRPWVMPLAPALIPINTRDRPAIAGRRRRFCQ